MSFKSLYKLYVMNDNITFDKLYKERFNSNATIKFDLFIKDNQFFFTYDKEIIALSSKIRDIDQSINKIFKTLPKIAVNQYIRKSLIDEIEYTNQIEGVISSRNDIIDLINEIVKKLKTKNRIAGLVNKYLLLNVQEIPLKNSYDIRKLYDEMLYGEILEEDFNNLPDGEVFRKGAVHIYKTSQKIAHTGIMPESKIIEYVDKTLNILNDSNIDVLVRVAIVHYLFGFIHPFYDGNGRINRFISSYILSKYFNEIIGFRLSMSVKENLSAYLDAFSQTNDPRNKGDITTFVYEFLNIIYKGYQKTEDYALEKKQIFTKYQSILEKMNNLTLNEYKLMHILIQCNIFGDFGLSKSELSNILEKGKTTVSEALLELKRKNLCEEIRSGRYIYYKASLEELDKHC